MTVVCSACGDEWDRDTALEVVCPTCNSQIGYYCGHKRPSGHKVRFGAKKYNIHVNRTSKEISKSQTAWLLKQYSRQQSNG